MSKTIRIFAASLGILSQVRDKLYSYIKILNLEFHMKRLVVQVKVRVPGYHSEGGRGDGASDHKRTDRYCGPTFQKRERSFSFTACSRTLVDMAG